jgi:hypothetical protein
LIVLKRSQALNTRISITPHSALLLRLQGTPRIGL